MIAMAESEKGSDKSLNLLEDIDKKLKDIVKDFKILKFNSDMSLSQMRSIRDTYIYTNANNLFILELFSIVAVIVAIGILTYEVFESYVVIAALLAIVIIAYIFLIADFIKLRSTVKTTKERSEKELSHMESISNDLKKELGNP